METSSADGSHQLPFAAHRKSANRAGGWRTGGLPQDPRATPLRRWAEAVRMDLTSPCRGLSSLAGAVCYDVCRGTKWGWLLVAGWAFGVIAMFVAWQPLWQPFAILLGGAALFLGWWLRQMPSNNRDWETSVALLPRAVREGDAVTIENFRNFEYRSPDDLTPRYETRTFHLANLKVVDIIFFNWGSPWMSHPVLVFNFGPDGRICVSIEVRYRKGQHYSILRSLYRQQELIFVVADERDVILRRTKHDRSQEAYLYRFSVGAEEGCRSGARRTGTTRASVAPACPGVLDRGHDPEVAVGVAHDPVVSAGAVHEKGCLAGG
jgi:hypothetical protein